ncbi:hypothetical protein IWX49DRAFT_369693 [Phyllosticta citricarpa]|uniref:Secreted protein n=2 Tax=Phyllosticta TaxID=121621 RepID=A0ABR1MIZ7_9PEZI
MCSFRLAPFSNFLLFVPLSLTLNYGLSCNSLALGLDGNPAALAPSSATSTTESTVLIDFAIPTGYAKRAWMLLQYPGATGRCFERHRIFSSGSRLLLCRPLTINLTPLPAKEKAGARRVTFHIKVSYGSLRRHRYDLRGMLAPRCHSPASLMMTCTTACLV